jgi:hypothetical protein
MVASDYKWGTMRRNIVPEVLHVPEVVEVRNSAGAVTTAAAAEAVHGPASIAPRPTHAELPTPTGAYNPAARNFHAFMHPLYVLETECKANLITIMKASLGPERVLELKDAGFAELDITPRETVDTMMRVDRVLPDGCKSETQCPVLVMLMALGSPRERVP